jgi:methylated-DNA-[protein]-cysteine S-methyltransferase
MAGRSSGSRSLGSGFHLFETPLGTCGVAWSERGVRRLQLPEADREATVRRLNASAGDSSLETEPPPRVRRILERLERYLEGAAVDFATEPLDLGATPPFHRRVYEAARAVGWGRTASYGELARLAGSPGAARAVGQALARNPVAIIIPCHRILAGGNRPGGFSAFGGLEAKARLLALEGVQLDPGPGVARPREPRGDVAATALPYLSAADPALGRTIRSIGPYALKQRKESTPFERLAEAVVHQQLSGTAAATIIGRLKQALDGRWTAEAVLATDPALLRSCGLSTVKAQAIQDLAAKACDGTLPGFAALRRLSDDEVVARLTAVKGVGPWTAQMFLMFSLMRPDVMPAHDYGLRRGFQIAFETPELPTPAEVLERAERWRPYRSVASWYLWRVADRANGQRSSG